ncbi:hypothetical protein ACFQ9V_07595 [Leifsonia sp. NPDC056665]|uniref:hypothetical protein n=1 Tax=Leifsonia sp. NPDC056665 TaxID=3345901 RepID=UPI00367D01DD
MEARPWPMNRLRRLGEHIRDETTQPADALEYSAVMSWYNDLATHIQSRLQAIPWAQVLGHEEVEIISRPKTIDTLRQKLQRDHRIPLPNIQDIAGIRVEAEMNLRQQNEAVAAICDELNDCATEVHDMRENPHSGYRAVHIWVRAYGGRAEIQVRTHIQGAWANMYEAAGDLFGREIRYGSLPEQEEIANLVTALQDFSLIRATALESARDSLDQLDESERQRTGPHKTSKDRSAIVRRKRKLRRSYENAENVFKDEMIGLRVAFDAARRNVVASAREEV